jgi:RES domain-containing protein
LIANGVHLKTRAWRAHDPRWSFQPISGRGAAITGGRFNAKGTEALYLALNPMTALAECTQGFAARIQPLTLCEYDVDAEAIADLTKAETRDALGVTEVELGCPWLTFQRAGRIAPSQAIARELVRKGYNGAIVQSFAPGVAEGSANLVLWKWSDRLPCRVMVYDPDGRLGSEGLRL